MQVKKWSKQQIVDFWRKWYHPANATLYLFGDFGCSVEEARGLIEKSFGMVPAVREGDSLQPYNSRAPNPFGTNHASHGESLPPPLPRPVVSTVFAPILTQFQTQHSTPTPTPTLEMAWMGEETSAGNHARQI